MNQIEIGKLIAKARKEKGYTQQELANLLFVTDKAVSKWERGLSLPEHEILNKLSKILDIEINDILIYSNRNDEWVGVINLCDDLNFNFKIFDQTIFEYIISYFVLFGIRDIYVLSSKKPQNTDYSNIVRLHFDRNISAKKKLIITDPFILFGPNLTRTVRELMSTGYNVDFMKNERELPIKIVTGSNHTMTKTFRNGYTYFKIEEKNLCTIENYLQSYFKLTNEKMFNLNNIIEARK